MKHLVIILLVFSLGIISSQGQIVAPDDKDAPVKRSKNYEDDDTRKFDKRNLFTGGGFGLQLGQSTYLELSPTLGYKVTEKLRPGVGFNYQLWSFKDATGLRSNQNILGWRAFASYQLFENIVGYGEYESLQLNYQGQQLFMNNSWLGLGYRQWMGANSAMDILFLRNLNYGPGTIQQAFYGSPWNIKMALIIGLGR